MTLPCLLLAFISAQEVPISTLPEDPLHHFAVLEVGPEGKSLEWTADFEGTLHVWAASEKVDPRIRVSRMDSGSGVAIDDNSGEGTAAYLWLEVSKEEALRFTVESAEGAGEVELHWIEAPESEQLHAAVEAMRRTLETVAELIRRGKLEQAREILDRDLDGLVRLEGAGESFELAGLAWDTGFVATRLGSLHLVDRAWSTTHTVLERLLPKDHSRLLLTKQNLATTRAKAGNLESAHDLFEYVHSVRERLLPKDHPDVLRAQLNLATARLELGDLQSARELFESVHAAGERILPKDDPDLLRAKQNLAVARAKLGDLEGARELEESVHAARERLLPRDHSDLLVARENLAITRLELGDLEGAFELFESVHAARERLLPKDHPDLLRAKQNLAARRFELGDLKGAGELFEFVYDARKQLLSEDHPDLLRAQERFAATRFELGDVQSSLDLFESVHAAWERLVPKDQADLLRVKLHLGRMRQVLGDVAGVYVLCQSVLTGQCARVERWATESPRIARAAARVELDRLASALFLGEWLRSQDHAGLDSESFATMESLRLVSTSSAEVARAAALVPELSELRVRLASLRRSIADRSQTPPGQAEAMNAWRADLVALAEQRDRLESEMRTVLETVGVRTELPTAARVAIGLARDAVLIAFLRYPRSFDRNLETGARPPVLDSVLAIVVDVDARVRRVELGAAEALVQLASRWRTALEQPVATEVEAGIGRRLRKALFDPCLAVVEGERPNSVHLVLDDFLHMVPFDALPLDATRRVGEEFRVHVETSVRRLMREQTSTGRRGTLVAFGGADFEAPGIEAPKPMVPVATPPIGSPTRSATSAPSDETGDRSGAPKRFKPLPEAEREVEAVSALFKETVGGDPLLRRRAEATKESLTELAPEARYLHLATHGWFASELEALSMLDRIGSDEDFKVLAGRAQETVIGFLPETLCGLALAGANQGRDSSGRVPGILTAEELATLDLSNCELAILSACETNVGFRRAGQGIQSLQSALHNAGARSAITSLWKVNDAATRRLMELLYTKLWKNQLGKTEALWQAKLALRTEGHPPRDWAGWVLTGDPD